MSQLFPIYVYEPRANSNISNDRFRVLQIMMYRSCIDKVNRCGQASFVASSSSNCFMVGVGVDTEDAE